MIGTKILNQKYQFDYKDRLGGGSFADVYKGINIMTNEVLAIKIINRQKISKYGQDMITQIGNEVNILQKICFSIDSPFVVKIYDAFESQNNIYIILEYCNGGTLQDLIDKNSNFSEQEAKIIFYQIILALDLLGDNNITHRDIKPENIFVNNDIMKLGDFGFAAQKDLCGTTCGTYPYMAPEMFQHCQYSTKVDVWALGVMLHQCLFGEIYFMGKNHIEVGNNVMKKPYNIPQNANISKELQDALIRCLKKDPKERINSKELRNHPCFNDIKHLPIFNQIRPNQQQLQQQSFLQQQQQQQQLQMQNQIQQQLQQVVNKLMNYRNGNAFMLDTAENLSMLVNQARFCIYYLLNYALRNLKKFQQQLIKFEVPLQLLGDLQITQQLWQTLIQNPIYQNLIQIINSDIENCQQLHDLYVDQLHTFLDSNYPANQVPVLKQIICKNVDNNNMNLQQLYSQEFQQKSQEFAQMFIQNSHQNKLFSVNLIQVAYRLKMLTLFDDILKHNFSFEKFLQNIGQVPDNNLKQMLDAGNYQQFIQN